jgi:hypothetical protein
VFVVKKLCLLIGLFMLGVLARPSHASAQSARRVVVSATAAPVFVKPDTAMTPLRLAKEGSVLNVIVGEGEWYQIEFQDPQWGRRVGYIEKRHVSVQAAASQQALDLTVAESDPAQNGSDRQVTRTMSQPVAETGPASIRQASVAQPTDQPSKALRTHVRDGFWFNGGLGVGYVGCDDCDERTAGASGGLSLGATVSDRVLLGLGSTGWYRSEDGLSLSVGTLDARLRFYPSVTSGFFVTGGVGLGTIDIGVDGFGTDSEMGIGVMLGLGWDIRVGSNVSLTPFWNGSAVRTSNLNANFGQLGLGVTIH